MAYTDKLVIYNDVLRSIGGHPLANLTTANTALQELEGAFPHAVEYMLAKIDWNFARRRATLTGVASSAVPPYTYSYALPSDFLRRVWVKKDAADEFDVEHAQIGAAIYGFETTALMEYITDHADVYSPATWPPHFTRCMVIYLGLLVGPKLARFGDADVKSAYGLLNAAMADAETAEAVYVNNAAVPVARNPVLRKALDFLGQALAPGLLTASQVQLFRWQMSKGWDHALKWCLEQGAWNFATKRMKLSSPFDPDEVMPGGEFASIVEGYSVDGDPDTATALPTISDYDYGFALPDDFVHKLWIKADVAHQDECPYQIIRDMIFTDFETCVLEYVATDEWISDPSHWPATFLEFMAAYLALSVAPEIAVEDGGRGARVKAAGVREKLDLLLERKKADAKTKDAAQQYPQALSLGNYARARFGSGGYGRRLN